MERKDYERAVIDLQSALKANPRNSEAHHQLGLIFLRRDEPAKAALSFRAAVEARPTNTEARLSYLELILAADDNKLLPQAEEQAAAVLEQRPNDPEVRHAIAVIRWRQGKVREAIEQLTQSLAISPRHLKSSATLALIQRTAMNDPAGAEQTMRRAVENALGSAESRVAFGRYYLTAGQSEAAEAQFRQAIGAEPGNARALIELSRVLTTLGKRAEAEQVVRRLSGLSDKTYRTAYSVYLHETGQPEAAVSELNRILEKDPEDRDARRLLIDLHLQANRIGEAEAELKKALGRDRYDLDLRERMSHLYMLSGRIEEGRKAIEEVLESRPDSALAHYIKALGLRGRGPAAEYRAEMETALELDPRLVPARVSLSQSLRNSGSLGAAFQLIDAAPADQKQQRAIAIERNWVLLAQGRHREVENDVGQLLAASREPSVLIQAGLIEIQQNRKETGRALLEEALRAEPENVQALNAVVFSLASEGKRQAAVERLQVQCARAPRSAPVQYMLGSWLEEAGDAAGAKKAFDAALAADPEFGPGSIAVGRLEMTQGQWDAAKRRFQTVLARDKANVDAWLGLGMAEEGLRRPQPAIEAYRAVLRMDPNHLVAKNNLAMALSMDKGTASQALILAQQLNQAAPNNPETKDTVGWVYYRNGMYDAALRHLEAAASQSRNATIQYHLAMAYFAAGKRSLGNKALAAALAMNPNAPEADMARRAAESIR